MEATTTPVAIHITAMAAALLQLRVNTLTAEEMQYARAVFDSLKNTKDRMTLPKILDPFSLLGSGLAFEDLKLRLCEHAALHNCEPLTDSYELRIKELREVVGLSAEELHFAKYTLVSLRSAGYNEATLCTFLEILTMIGSSFPEETFEPQNTYSFYQQITEDAF